MCRRALREDARTFAKMPVNKAAGADRGPAGGGTRSAPPGQPGGALSQVVSATLIPPG
jgi:hypothetical protein